MGGGRSRWPGTARGLGVENVSPSTNDERGAGGLKSVRKKPQGKDPGIASKEKFLRKEPYMLPATESTKTGAAKEK